MSIIKSASVNLSFGNEFVFAIHFMPAAFAAFIPLRASSTTTHSSGLTLSFSAALRNMSGAGFPFLTSSAALTTTSKLSDKLNFFITYFIKTLIELDASANENSFFSCFSVSVTFG